MEFFASPGNLIMSLRPTLEFQLWEMACARGIGLTNLPIVCVNVDGYYENFRQMLLRAHEDELTYMEPDEILHFEDTAQCAVRWLEEKVASSREDEASSSSRPKLMTRKSVLRKSSFISAPVTPNGSNNSFGRWKNGELVLNDSWAIPRWTLTFVAGLAVGLVAASQMNRSKP